MLITQPLGVQVGLMVVASAPDLTRAEAMRRWAELGNPILDVDNDGTIHAVAQIERPKADEGQLVYVCDHCNHYGDSRAEVEAHEATCPERP